MQTFICRLNDEDKERTISVLNLTRQLNFIRMLM